jgi:NitT/TauT family transport system substrate-binding protein
MKTKIMNKEYRYPKYITIEIIIGFSFLIILISNSFTLIVGQPTNNKPIRLGFPIWIPDFLAYISQEKGYFKRNNVDVNLTLIPKYGDVVNEYSNGNLDGIFTVYSDAVIQQSQDIKTKIVYNLDLSYKADAIVGKGNNLSEIKGKKIGVDGINSYSQYFVLKSLQKVGLTEGDVQFADVPVQNVTTELQKGSIFAGETSEPYISEAVKQGFKILYFAGNIPGVITDVLAFHSDIVQQRPQDIQNLLKSLIEAKADFDNNTFEDIAIMSLKSGLSKEQILEGINNINILGLNDNIKNSMNQHSNQTTSLYTSGNDIGKFYAERGVISEYPNVDDMIDPQFVTALLKENNMTMPQ